MPYALRKRTLVTGCAGFLGSHLCERLLERGDDVLCVDNFFTGTKDNIVHLLDNPHFELICHDVTFPLYVEVDEVYNLACPASPIHYQHDPVQTTKTSVHGAIKMLGLAKRVKAKIFQASTSEVYGDPEVHPQTEDHWRRVNPIGTRACYDEGKRCAETLFFDYHCEHHPIRAHQFREVQALRGRGSRSCPNIRVNGAHRREDIAARASLAYTIRAMKPLEPNSELMRVAEALSADPGLLLAVAFGSASRGRARPDSDIDIAVLAQGPLTSERREQTIRRIAEATGRPVDLVDLRNAGVAILRTILAEGRTLLCRDQRARERLITTMLADVEDFLPLRQQLIKERRDRWIH
jgi:predicted nucleotidyltransferase